MTSAEQSQRQELFGSFDEVSGVFRRRERMEFICSDDDEPSPVYVELSSRDHRYFLGVRFPHGIIVAESWATPMWCDGVPDEVIDTVSTWLRERAL